jgi:hypothetical protein
MMARIVVLPNVVTQAIPGALLDEEIGPRDLDGDEARTLLRQIASALSEGRRNSPGLGVQPRPPRASESYLRVARG